MIFSTFETKTSSYIWNTGEKTELEKGVLLSDYTELQEEFNQKTLNDTFEWVRSRNQGLIMKSPSLMIVTTGFYKSCKVWIDKSLLTAKPELEDLQKGFEYYSEQ